MSRTEIQDLEGLAMQSVKEEAERFYRDRDDTVVLRWGLSQIRLLRAGRALVVWADRSNTSKPALDVRISKVFTSFSGERVRDPAFVSLVSATAFLFWRAYLHDPNLELYRWVVIGGLFLILGPIVLIKRREYKAIEKVFPPAEVDRLRNRLRFRVEQVMESISADEV